MGRWLRSWWRLASVHSGRGITQSLGFACIPAFHPHTGGNRVCMSIGFWLMLTAISPPQATPGVARFEEATGVGLSPVSPTKPLVAQKPSPPLPSGMAPDRGPHTPRDAPAFQCHLGGPSACASALPDGTLPTSRSSATRVTRPPRRRRAPHGQPCSWPREPPARDWRGRSCRCISGR